MVLVKNQRLWGEQNLEQEKVKKVCSPAILRLSHAHKSVGIPARPALNYRSAVKAHPGHFQAAPWELVVPLAGPHL